MKRSIPIEIGEGLFSNEPVPVEVDFGGHVATLYMTALTQDVVAELAKEGVKLDEASLKKLNEEGQAKQSKKILAKFLHGWEGLKDINGKDIDYTEQNRDAIAVTEALGYLVGYAKDLGITKREEEEKN